MSNVAIVLGNALYHSGNLDDLPCCKDDVDAVRALLEATGKYDTVSAHIDLDGDGMKEAIRDAIAQHDEIGEVFFYFSGHGAQKQSEFYFCGTAFDSHKPNETGLSTAELHSLLRSADPTLVVKVIDACHSGRALIKSEEAFARVTKGELGNFIQIASCLDSQFSLTSDPLSKFTQSFCAATLRKEEGAIFYSDIVNSLRDIYLADDEQTPHFVSQGTARDIFVEDARRLADFRSQFENEWLEAQEEVADEVQLHSDEHRAGMLQLMTKAETQFASQDLAQVFIATLFDDVTKRVNSSEFTDFFDVRINEHSQFREDAIEPFIVQCLSREKRPDNFVTAYIGKKKKPQPVWMSGLTSALYGEEFMEVTTLALNCSLPRVQMKAVFQPKFKSLDQLTLILACAPSLNSCYIFERSARHLRTDWEAFDDEGHKIVENWYERPWTEDMSWLAEATCDRLFEAVERHLEQTTKRIADQSADQA